jgi:integrase
MARTRGTATRPYRSGGILFDPKTKRYLARISLPDGTRPKKWWNTESQAKAWLAGQQHLIDSGTLLAPGATNVRVAAYTQKWFAELGTSATRGKSTTRRWGTLAGYEDKLNWFLRAYGNHRLTEITPDHIKAFYVWLRVGVVPPNPYGVKARTELSNQGRPLKVTGIVHLHHLLRPMFTDAFEESLIPRNPMESVKAPGVPPEELFKGFPLDLEGWRKVLAVAKHHRNGAAVLMPALWGTRRGEGLGLRWTDIALNGPPLPYITIKRTLQRVTGKGPGKGLIGEPPKNPSSERTAAIPAILVEALQAHRESGFSGPQYVFVSPLDSSRPMDPGYMYRRVWTPIRDELNLTCRPHDLRHTLKTLLMQYTDPAVVRVEFINQFFGWSEGGSASHYTHLRVNDTQAVANEIDRLASGDVKQRSRQQVAGNLVQVESIN